MPKDIITFDDHFTDQTMRVDYFHTGDAKIEIVALDKIYAYGQWGRSRKNLTDPFNNGTYSIKIYDDGSGELLFSKGFDSIFKEYQTTGPASQGVAKTLHESALLPSPKNKIRLVLEKRNTSHQFEPIYKTAIDPTDVSIIKKDLPNDQIKVFKGHYSGDPQTRLDIAIVGDGYTAAETEKFERDLKKVTDIILKHEPFKSKRDKINIYGILKPSLDSGIDEPRANIFKNTVLGSTFNAMGSERYILTEDNKALHDIAAPVPYDALCIMVNHGRYGGGGIYNFFLTFTADNQFLEYLFIHEFGHSLAGLADEYYTSAVHYDMYPPGIEPIEPNITRLPNAKKLKWKGRVERSTPIPTPWEKADYDKMDLAWQERRQVMNDEIAELKRERASEKVVQAAEAKYNEADKTHTAEVRKYLDRCENKGVVGAFEGAGYASEGMFRPMTDCIMFSKGTFDYCKVCQDMVAQVVDFYSE